MWSRAIASPLVRERAQKFCGTIVVRTISSQTQTAKLESILQPVSKKSEKEQRISRAMRAYLEHAQRQDVLLKSSRQEFELGKRHLANMMGWDPEDINQEDIDEAIAYLLPSGLFEPRARPMMKPPEFYITKQKLVQFDYTGRPFNYLFYTTKANFYSYLHEAVSHLNRLDEHQKKMRSKGIRTPEASEKLDTVGYGWITLDQLADLCTETIKDENYTYFIQTMQRLADHPYSKSAGEFLLTFLVEQRAKSEEQSILPLMHDEGGNAYMEARGERKTARAVVRVTGNGSGLVRINGNMLVSDYFHELKDRIQVMYPLQFTGLLTKVDVDATIFYKNDEYHLGEQALLSPSELKALTKPLRLQEGSSCEASALRLAISRALCSFVTLDDVKLMRLAGLITRDPRTRERKKPGQRGARRRYHWRKR